MLQHRWFEEGLAENKRAEVCWDLCRHAEKVIDEWIAADMKGEKSGTGVKRPAVWHHGREANHAVP
jgi:hypothetical protein